MSGIIEQYDAMRANNEFIFVLFYRGSWCPFCQAYLKDLESLSDSISTAGGKVFTVTSEAASELPKMRAASGFKGEMLVDTENVLAKELKRRGIVDVAISEHRGYPHGMAQPAIVVGSKDQVFYQWAIVPTYMNIGGANDRPLLNEVWDNVHANMQGNQPVHATVKQTTLMTGLMQMIFG